MPWRDTMPCGIPCRVGYLLLGDDPCARDVPCSACRRVGRVLGDPSGIGKADVQELLQHVHLQSRHTVGHVVCGMPRVMFYVSQEPLQRASARPRSEKMRRAGGTQRSGGGMVWLPEVCAVFRTRQAHPQAGMPHTYPRRHSIPRVRRGSGGLSPLSCALGASTGRCIAQTSRRRRRRRR